MLFCSSHSFIDFTTRRNIIPIPECDSEHQVELIIPLLEPTKSRTQVCSMSEHLLESCHFLTKGDKRKDCVVCSDRKAGNRTTTVYTCDACPDKPALCVEPCFKKYHIKRPSLYHRQLQIIITCVGKSLNLCIIIVRA